MTHEMEDFGMDRRGTRCEKCLEGFSKEGPSLPCTECKTSEENVLRVTPQNKKSSSPIKQKKHHQRVKTCRIKESTPKSCSKRSCSKSLCFC